MNEPFLFAQDTDESVEQADVKWKILIIDDEPEVHNISRLVLNDIEFDGGGVELISAFSGAEAKQMMLAQGDSFAVAIVDVVMESNHAGLDFVRWVREELDNHKIRLILRTGQPGEAPEESVIRDYDINDYKNKTELTALRLKTSFYSALRGYRDILTIEKHRIGLERIIAASSEFIECDTLPQFASAILRQVALVLGINENAIICCAAAKEAKSGHSAVNVLALNQPSDHFIKGELEIPEKVEQRLRLALSEKHSIYEDDYFIGYFTTKRGTENLLYVAQDRSLEPMQHSLLEFFANNIALAHENLKLRDEIKESQKELSYVIGEAVEMRSKETGSHVKRVAHICHKLAVLYGLDDYDAEMIKLASPLHDVGKVGIPDYILNKAGKHTEEEFEIMKQHAVIGYDMLKKSDNPILQMGARIAHQHHEKWDGSGYPKQLRGEQIHLAGRIAALADVFDALGSRRCYKEPWSSQQVLDYLADSAGTHFEPKLVALMLDNMDDFLQIRIDFPDDVTVD